MDESPRTLAEAIKTQARALGFSLVGIAPAVSPTGYARLKDWLAAGYAGEMTYLARREAAYEHPRHVQPAVRSVIMLGWNYHQPAATPPPTTATASLTGRVAEYAQGAADYHDRLREPLQQLADFIHTQVPRARTRMVVDTAPLLEREFAQLAGIGWFGKNTMLINKQWGSWFFLAALLTDLDLPADAPHQTNHCGTCTRCLDACPTEAFTAPGVLDARRCIAYLTIESRTACPPELFAGVGDWLFGCDICQEVCPWNRKVPATTDPLLTATPALAAPDPLRWLTMTDAEMAAEFADTPLSRPGWNGLRRNAAVVIGNSGQPEHRELLATVRDQTDDPVLRETCVAAIERLSRVPDVLDSPDPT